MNAAPAPASARTGAIGIGSAAERAISNLTEGRILLDTKHGVILSNGKAIPHEIPIYEGDPEGWEKRPNCPNCGGRMGETVLGGPSYSWYCPADECKDAHAAAFAVLHGKARAADIDTRPEKILPAYGVPEKYLAASLSAFDGTPGIRRAATAWAAEPAGNLYLWGGTGTGKTYLAAAILREYIKGARRTAYFRTVADLIRDIRATFDRDGGRRGEPEGHARTAQERAISPEGVSTYPEQVKAA